MEKEKIRIAFLTHYTNLYGANRSLVSLVSTLKELYPIQPLVIVPEHGYITELLTEKNIDFIISKAGTWIHTKPIERLKIPFKLFKHSVQLVKLYLRIRRFRPQIIHSNSSVIYLGFFLSKLYHVPHIWHIREFGREDYNYYLDFGSKIFTYLLDQSDLVIAISQAIARQKLQHVKAKKIVIYNGVIPESKLEKPSKEKSLRSRPFVFAIVGKIMPSKGQLEAVRAFNKALEINPQMKLQILGDFDDESYKKLLLGEVERSGIQDNVKFLGYIKKPEEVYKQTHVLLMCSQKEGMGRVTVEALSYGIPVIGYDGGATSEIVIDNVNGLLFSNFDALPNLILKLSNQAEVYQRLRQQTAVNLAQFTNESCARQFYKALSGMHKTFLSRE